MAYAKVLISAVTAIWVVLSFAYTLPFAADASHKQAVHKHTSHYTVSNYTVFEESSETECKKADDQKNDGTANIFLQVASIKFKVASVTPGHLHKASPLYILHRRLLI